VDVPADVESVLTQLFGEAAAAFESGDTKTGVAAVTSAATVATNKLPEGNLREQVLHGCERTEELATADDEPAVAAEYATLLEQRVTTAGSE